MSTETIRAEGEDLLGENAKEIGAQPENVLYFGLVAPNHAWAKTKANMLKEEYPEVASYMLDEIGEMQSDLIFEKETGKNKVDTSTWLSTGWYTFLLALDMCEEISLYGFVSENYCRENPDSKIRYHYFQSWDIPTECEYYKSHEDTTFIGGHRFITEKAIFARWASMYNVTFHYPEWTPGSDLSRPIDTPFVTRKENKGALTRLFERFVRWGFGTMM
ncbi:alpha-N-acetylgalactosaminide alpha-2,6-sialyltransferase 3-like isoform X1 [Amphiura filiformis]|uniref:alpha-N-acetylgalactosaminide alpha-2,6-sialyltransferase 3-like isoform X1 n=1 Tax=Amphiura filiformis TaxID=82378 RepID=UPI003B20FB5E